MSNKQKCFHCKRRNHHHRSICQFKFGQVCHKGLKLNSPNDIKQIVKRDTQTQTDEKKKSVPEQTEVKLELAECKKENATLKDRISEVETEKEKLQTPVRGYTETITQQSGEISQLRGTLEGLKNKEIGFIGYKNQ